MLAHSVVLLLINTYFLSFHRDSVVEILFEQDNEETSVATLILDSLVQVSFYCKQFLECLHPWRTYSYK